MSDTPITPAQTDALAKLAEIPPAGSEDRKTWLELAYEQTMLKWAPDTFGWSLSNDAILTLMSEARKQGQRDILGASASPSGHSRAEPFGLGPLAECPSRGPADLVSYLHRQWGWSKETFGPALRTKGIVQHITKELREIEADPHDLAEWIDVIILAMDGFWRHGGKPEDLLPAMQAKQDKNFARQWPDWRTMGEDQAIEHDRSGEAAQGTAARSDETEGLSPEGNGPVPKGGANV